MDNTDRTQTMRMDTASGHHNGQQRKVVPGNEESISKQDARGSGAMGQQVRKRMPEGVRTRLEEVQERIARG